ncbi:trans-Golgi network integral membrane protein 2-like [Anopheles maculipalpis]|uniref:trans-Golgi network integral membrane protein 2-like n=1 Tax=Anopheles maculipalpis TaxID=1496333 RepID=UPI002158BDE5|nr:trans-Golgi network integral membrane protein 2-like [Anopheles maculipalpis]
MQPEAILLTLAGLISVVLTSPLVGKQTPSVLQQPAAAAAAALAVEGGPINTSQTVQETRIQRLQTYCSLTAHSTSCSTYKEMMGIAASYRIPQFEQLVDKDLSRTLSQAEDDNFCGDLSKTLKRLSQILNTHTVGQYERVPSCVRLCYDEDSKLTDMCRVLSAGYKLILQSIDKKEIKHQSPVQVPPEGANSPDSIANHSGFVKIVPAVAEMKRPQEAINEVKDKNPLPISNGTIDKSDKKEESDKSLNPAAKPVPPASDIISAKKPETEAKTVPVGDGNVVAKTSEKAASKEQPPAIPVVQVPQEAVVQEKNEGDLVQQQQQGDLDAGGDLGPFDDDPKLEGNLANGDAAAGKAGATQTQYENSDESEAIASAEDVNENGDDLELNRFQPDGKPAVLPEKEKQGELSESSKASDIVPGADPFYEQKDSNFFPYFLFAMFSCAMLYVAYHNKSKLLALVVEGRRTSSGRGGFSKGRKHTAAYRKLDSNLEEAITSGSGSGGHSSTQIIY